MFTRLLQATLLTSAIYLTLMLSPQQSLGPSGTLRLMNAYQPIPHNNQPHDNLPAPAAQLDWLKQRLAEAFGAISRPTQSNVRF